MNEWQSSEARAAISIVTALHEAGFQALFAGGCVRDMLLGRTPKDFDIATNAMPDEVENLFPRTKTVGKSFGVMLVRQGDLDFEVATFRKDLDYEDGRRPSMVEYSTAEEDARRRDFTINGMFYDPLTEKVIDLVDGAKDLREKRLRTIGDPHERFSEDYLRMLRAVRLASVLSFEIEKHTAEAIAGLADKLNDISNERVEQEFTRMLLESPQAGNGVRILRELGLLAVILPEIDVMAGQEQPPEFHPEGDVFQHTVCMLNAMKNPSRPLAYAVLLHDVGKPPTASVDKSDSEAGRIRFNNHAKVGADMAAQIMKRLRLPKNDIEVVARCVHDHMRFMDVQHMRSSTLRRWIAEPTFLIELELHRLDCICSHGKLDNYERLTDFMQKLSDEPVLPKSWVDGHDVMALGVEPGPEVGRWLNRAFERQLEGLAADREELLHWLERRIQADR